MMEVEYHDELALYEALETMPLNMPFVLNLDNCQRQLVVSVQMLSHDNNPEQRVIVDNINRWIWYW